MNLVGSGLGEAFLPALQSLCLAAGLHELQCLNSLLSDKIEGIPPGT